MTVGYEVFLERFRYKKSRGSIDNDASSEVTLVRGEPEIAGAITQGSQFRAVDKLGHGYEVYVRTGVFGYKVNFGMSEKSGSFTPVVLGHTGDIDGQKLTVPYRLEGNENFSPAILIEAPGCIAEMVVVRKKS